MEYILIPIVAAGSALLTFFSGFGLGTLLLPAFLLFFPVTEAILLTAVVHLLNNLFKGSLVFKHTSLPILLKFGIPSILGAYAGSRLLENLGAAENIFQYTLGSYTAEISWMNISLGSIMLFFTLMEIMPSLQKINFSEKWMIPGGILSGFFGGLSGHQGALRSAFLIRAGLPKEVYISTGVMIALLVDFTRLSQYIRFIPDLLSGDKPYLLILAIFAAFTGSWYGNKLLSKTTYSQIRYAVAGFMGIISILVLSGIL